MTPSPKHGLEPAAALLHTMLSTHNELTPLFDALGPPPAASVPGARHRDRQPGSRLDIGQRPLAADIQRVVDALLDGRGGLGRCEMLPLPRLLDDTCDKFTAFDVQGRASAFVIVSPPAHPGAVRDAADRARTARAALGAPLGASVLVPWHVGHDADGLSYSVAPFCQAISGHGVIGRLQRSGVAQDACDWLAAVTQSTTVTPDSSAIEAAFVQPLRSLAAQPRASEAVRHAALAALGALESGSWQPRQLLAHNDFWLGNLLRQPPGDGAPTRFRVIDWGGARLPGHALYDLVRIAMSLRIGRRRLRREVARHCHALDCSVPHAVHHLMAALAALGADLGEWPVEQFVQTAANSHRYLCEAIG